MATRTSGRRASPGGPGDGEPGWWERLENRPVGLFSAGVVIAGWIVLTVLTVTGVWPLEVTFFEAVALLTFVLGLLSLYAALIQARRPKSDVLRLRDWIADFENYFRWLTPVAFLFGMIFAHYFWH